MQVLYGLGNRANSHYTHTSPLGCLGFSEACRQSWTVRHFRVLGSVHVWNKFRRREAVFLGDHSSSVFIFIIHIPLSFQDVGLFPTCMCRCPRTGHGGMPLFRCSCRHPFVGAFLPCASARAGCLALMHPLYAAHHITTPDPIAIATGWKRLSGSSCMLSYDWIQTAGAGHPTCI